MDSRSIFMAFLKRPSTLKELQNPNQLFSTEEVQSFVSSIRDRNTLLRELAPLLLQADGFRAGALAIMCGSFVERGGDVAIPIEQTLALMVRQLQQARDYVSHKDHMSAEELFQHYPEAARAHYALPFTLLAAMTMLARDVEARKQLRSRQDVIELVNELEEHYETLYYVREVLALLDDKDLLILDPLNKRGFLTRLVGVQDRMYHCYALLQHELLEYAGPGYLKATPTDPDMVQYAQNRDLTAEDHPRMRGRSDEQRFGFYYPGAWQTGSASELNGLLFFPGSASFFEIPVIAGMPVLMVGEKFMTFSWEPANMYPILHEALKSRVSIVRELTPEEVEVWLGRFRRGGSER